MRLKIFGFQLIFAKFYATLTTRFRFCLLVTKGGSCNIYAYLIYLFSFFSASSQRKFAFVHDREMLPDSTIQDSPLGQWTYFLIWFYESPDIPKANEDFFRKCSSDFRIRSSLGEWILSVWSKSDKLPMRVCCAYYLESSTYRRDRCFSRWLRSV